MRTKFLTIVFFTILVFSLVPVAQGTTSREATRIIETPTVNEIMEQPKSDVLIKYVIFADNSEEFATLKTMDTLRTYEHLEAVVVALSDAQFKLIDYIKPHRIFELSEFENIRIDPIVTSPVSAGLGLDNSPLEMQSLGLPQMYELGYNGTGVVIAINDNGIDTNHLAFQDKMVLNENFNTHPSGITGSVCKDHGTLVAGTAAGSGALSNGTIDPDLRGSAFGAKLAGVNFGCLEDGGLVGDYLAAFDYILANNETIDVVNMSWGISGSAYSYEAVMEKWQAAGIIPVSSAGNDGPNPNTVSGGPGLAYPTITVGASCILAQGDSPQGFDCVAPPGSTYGLADFSSKGYGAGYNFKPDITAPGYNMISPAKGGGYDNWDGTSAASPIAAGAIATLISALKANDIPYNLGLIKAVIMNNATGFSGFSELDIGKGNPNIYKSWMNVQNAERGTDGVPMAVDMSPRLGTAPVSVFRNVFKDITLKIPFTLVSSHPNLTQVTFTGNLGDILTFDTDSYDTDKYSQKAFLKVNTIGVESGTYSGKVVLSVGSKAKVSATYSISVGAAAKAKVLLDLRHTSWDSTGADVIGGTNIGEMIDLANDKRIWVQEYYDVITPEILADFDVLWLPDPSEREYPFETLGIAERFLETEVSAIEDFVMDGGSLFVDFNGALDDGDEFGYSGTNATEINRVISKFGITTNIAAVPTPGAPFVGTLNNITGIVGGATRLTHFGNYLQVSGGAQSVAEYDGKTFTAIHDILGGGRVLVASTNFWMDNSGVQGLYAAKEGDKIVSSNTWDWLTATTQVKYVSGDVTATKISGSFQVLVDGTPISSTPTVKRLGNELLAVQSITPTAGSDDTWEFEYDITEDGQHFLQVAYAAGSYFDYAAWQAVVDNTGPVITPHEENPENAVIERTSMTILKFDAADSISELSKSDFTIVLDGEDLTDLRIHSYRDMVLIVALSESLMDDDDAHEYELELSAVDDNNNVGRLTYHFKFGDPNAVPSTSDAATTPFNAFFAFLALFAIPIIRRKN
ncbi:MAG: S8 family serine peptidase [Candidatus Heimdallarchaeota archaeon]|nr:S8 family serine peptidase [Candidatus Heimdallarchaeota archaeon]